MIAIIYWIQVFVQKYNKKLTLLTLNWKFLPQYWYVWLFYILYEFLNSHTFAADTLFFFLLLIKLAKETEYVCICMIVNAMYTTLSVELNIIPLWIWNDSIEWKRWCIFKRVYQWHFVYEMSSHIFMLISNSTIRVLKFELSTHFFIQRFLWYYKTLLLKLLVFQIFHLIFEFIKWIYKFNISICISPHKISDLLLQTYI